MSTDCVSVARSWGRRVPREHHRHLVSRYNSIRCGSSQRHREGDRIRLRSGGAAAALHPAVELCSCGRRHMLASCIRSCFQSHTALSDRRVAHRRYKEPSWCWHIGRGSSEMFRELEAGCGNAAVWRSLRAMRRRDIPTAKRERTSHRVPLRTRVFQSNRRSCRIECGVALQALYSPEHR